jgi:putative tryptophan/tyrosine transport system substrate-binding protein
MHFDRLRRREFITLLSAAAIWSCAPRAQSAGMLRVGMVAAQPKSAPIYQAFLRRLAELGYEQGKNLVFEFIQVTNIEDYARGNRELVSRGVDILIAVGAEIALKTALAATDRLPIVMLAIDYDPIALGYVNKPGTSDRQRYWHLFSAN